MKRRLVKYAELYIADLVEDIAQSYEEFEDFTVDNFKEQHLIDMVYSVKQDGSRLDGVLELYIDEELEAIFQTVIAC